jgi:hypothetical protein
MKEVRMSRALIAGLVVFSVCAGFSHADRGSIPFKPNVQVFEPTQRAMIAWNGEEELLLLSTDLRASEPTKVLEVMPLPAEPKVAKGDVEVFRKATALINRKLREREKASPGRVWGKDAPQTPAGEITFHEKIGAHDVSVARVISPDGFLEWVNGYLKKAGVENPVVPQPIRGVVEEYIREGFTWFVFDVVSLDEKPKTNEAIQYRFKTDSLFYPVKISRTDTGQTSIELLVLTPRLLRTFPGIPVAKVELRHPPVDITAEELRSLSEDMDALLGHRDDMKLRIWRIQGDFSSFDKDLVAR